MLSKKKIIYGLIGIYRTMLQKNRKHPKINEGDMVRVNIKTNKFAKGYEPNWSRERYNVVGIKGNQYLIPGINKDKLYLRHESLKV